MMTEPDDTGLDDTGLDDRPLGPPPWIGASLEHRIDPPHVKTPVGAAPAGVLKAQPALAADVEFQAAENYAEAGPADGMLDLNQLRRHAAQLATHLDRMREQLDQREAELNARVAETESQLRTARLWLSERDQEIAHRTADIDERTKTLQQGETQLAMQQSLLAEQMQELHSRQVRLAAAEAQVAAREGAGDQASADLLRQRQELHSTLNRQQQQIDRRRLASVELVRQLLRGCQRRREAVEDEYQRRSAEVRLIAQQAYQEEYERVTAELSARDQALETSEAMLADAQQQLREAQRNFEQTRYRHNDQMRVEREALARRERELADEWDRRQHALAVRSEQLDSRQAALDDTREQVGTLHRESLEVRLATEELWARLSEAAPAAGLEQSLGRIRQRLGESYRLEHVAVAEQRNRLEALRNRLAEQHTRLAEEKQQLQTWVEERQQGIERQAARLVAREQELNHQDDEFADARRAWDEERMAYQAEIRSLLAQRRDRVAA
ncbi:MAG: hypothetical protein K8T25_01620 [Planctomycetia bacterium]|nr:hypothetical protein [Planctomycetia bacterium]